MHAETTYGAPWGTALKVLTAFSVCLLAGILVVGVATGPKELVVWRFSMVWIPTAVLCLGIFFTIRGYTLTSEFVVEIRERLELMR